MVKEVSNKVFFGELKTVTPYNEDYKHGKRL